MQMWKPQKDHKKTIALSFCKRIFHVFVTNSYWLRGISGRFCVYVTNLVCTCRNVNHKRVMYMPCICHVHAANCAVIGGHPRPLSLSLSLSLSLNIYIYMYIYTCKRINIYTCRHISIHMYYVNIYIHIYLHTPAYTYRHLYIHMYVYEHTCTYIYIPGRFCCTNTPPKFRPNV